MSSPRRQPEVPVPPELHGDALFDAFVQDLKRGGDGRVVHRRREALRRLQAKAPPTPLHGDALFEAFVGDLKQGGDGRVARRRPETLGQWLREIGWSWLLFPLVGALVVFGLLEYALNLGSAAALPIAALLMLGQWVRRRWRNRGRPRATSGEPLA